MRRFFEKWRKSEAALVFKKSLYGSCLKKFGKSTTAFGFSELCFPVWDGGNNTFRARKCKPFWTVMIRSMVTRAFVPI
jgi:hypothetical protein